ncbi:MAG TPA: LLM class flavin-dependent oxidoreductase [Acidimicrobiales bacterium]|nr:LLM class flavin-dependent oxidoreductase [Acidimicrobiales bacterium]
MHLAVALEGAGWHPAAWRAEGARPEELFRARYWSDLVLEAEAGQLDFVTFEDALGLQSLRRDGPDGRVNRVRGRLDAVMTAARVAPVTTAIGLVPTAVTTHTEPFHLSKALATLDHVSGGRAGTRVQVSGRADHAAHFGRRVPEQTAGDGELPTFDADDLFEEAADYVELVRRLWDSWEDDAEIRDAATGRFVDRERLHYVDFEGRFFRVRGPSITPRPPQGQPVVAALAHVDLAYRLAASSTDVVFVTPQDTEDAARIVDSVRAYELGHERGAPLVAVADLLVTLGPSRQAADARWDRLDELDGQEHRSDAQRFTGRAEDLADLLVAWHDAGVQGFRLRPAVLPTDLVAVTRELVPTLRRMRQFRVTYEGCTLRERLGLVRPANRYRAARVGALR